MPKFKVRQSFTVHTVKEVEVSQEEYDHIIRTMDNMAYWDAELVESLGTQLVNDETAIEVDHYDDGFYISGLQDCQTEIEYFD